MKEPRWSEVTAIFGGSFDPPHVGHLEAIRGLLRSPGVKRVRVMAAGNPRLKAAQTPAKHRLRMTELMVDEIRDPRVLLDTREALAPGPTFTAATLEELAREESELAFVVGTDHLAKLPQWHRFPEVLSLCHWIVLRRQPENVEATRAGLGGLLQSNLIRPAGDPSLFQVTVGRADRSMKLVETPAPPVSSTDIRRRIALNGATPAETMPPSVERYLKENELYGTTHGISGNR